MVIISSESPVRYPLLILPKSFYQRCVRSGIVWTGLSDQTLSGPVCPIRHCLDRSVRSDIVWTGLSDQALSGPVCPIRHCLDRSLFLISCHQQFCICKAKMDSSLFLHNFGVFVSVVQRRNWSICWVYLKVSRNAIPGTSSEKICKIFSQHTI
jgi:hypothetical protein